MNRMVLRLGFIGLVDAVALLSAVPAHAQMVRPPVVTAPSHHHIQPVVQSQPVIVYNTQVNVLVDQSLTIVSPQTTQPAPIYDFWDYGGPYPIVIGTPLSPLDRAPVPPPAPGRGGPTVGR